MSYSSISDYLACGRYFKLSRIDRPEKPQSSSLAFGTAMHSLISRALIELSKSGNLPNLEAIWRQEWEKESAKKISYGFDSSDSVAALGMRIFGNAAVQSFFSGLHPARDEHGPIVDRKYEIYLPGVDIPIIGFIDTVLEDGVITDFKSASRSWSQDQAEAEIQPLFYLLGAKQMGIPHRSGLFRHIVLTKTKETKINVYHTYHPPHELMFVMEVIQDVWTKIKGQVYEANPKACFAYGSLCEFFNVCRGTQVK